MTQALQRHAPEVYFYEQITRDVHYRFMLEDLNLAHRTLYKKNDKLSFVYAMPYVHSALQVWVERNGDGELIKFDNEFALEIEAYAREGVRQYVQKTGSPTGKELEDKWDHVSRILSDGEILSMRKPVPIHGDYHSGNMFQNIKDASKIKLIDWEWAGVGVPHADLASLLKKPEPGVDDAAIRIFADNDKTLNINQHRELLNWSRLQRNALDAGILTMQFAGPGSSSAWLRDRCDGALANMHRTVESLVAGGPRWN